jgi:hypothetical protein
MWPFFVIFLKPLFGLLSDFVPALKHIHIKHRFAIAAVFVHFDRPRQRAYLSRCHAAVDDAVHHDDDGGGAAGCGDVPTVFVMRYRRRRRWPSSPVAVIVRGVVIVIVVVIAVGCESCFIRC